MMKLKYRGGGYWLTSGRCAKYQAILLDNPIVTLKAASILHPATLLPNNTEELMHDCIQIIEPVYSSHPELMDQPLENPDLEMFTDGGSFMDQEECKAGYMWW